MFGVRLSNKSVILAQFFLTLLHNLTVPSPPREVNTHNTVPSWSVAHPDLRWITNKYFYRITRADTV